MTVGVSVSVANSMLDSFGDVYVQMHTGDPGVAGTSNVAAFSTRVLADLPNAAAAVRSLSAPIEWGSGSIWTGAAQTVTHVSTWTAATGGTFVFSAALTAQVDFVAGLRPRLQSLSVAIPSIAAN